MLILTYLDKFMKIYISFFSIIIIKKIHIMYTIIFYNNIFLSLFLFFNYFKLFINYS